LLFAGIRVIAGWLAREKFSLMPAPHLFRHIVIHPDEASGRRPSSLVFHDEP
jgi:hypothetical protein